MLRSGSLNRKVTIQQRGPAKDAWGQPVPGGENWTPVATVWANVRNLTGREAAAAGGDASTITGSIRIRYRTGLTAGMRVLLGDTAYNVQAVLPDEQRREYVDLACTSNLQNKG